MFWEVGIFTVTLAAAIFASDNTGTTLEEGGYDTAGHLINKTDGLRYLDTAGVQINNTDILRMSDEAFEFHNGNTMEERRGCFPTLSCTRAGGYCIRPKADCNGTVDTQGCRRGRRCKCCIPDETTSAPLTCPTTQSIHTCPAVTPCPETPWTYIPTTDDPEAITTAIPTTEIPTTDIPTTYDPEAITTAIPTTEIPTTDIPTTDEPEAITTAIPTTEIPTTDIPTTLPVTTNGPNLRWLRVGSERFVRFPQEMNWFSARALCKANGLDLFEPKNIQAVAIYLEDNFSDSWYWIGAKGDGRHVAWLSGGVIPRSAPWYSDYYSKVGTDKCTEIITWNGASRRGSILAPVDCITRTNIDVLCG